MNFVIPALLVPLVTTSYAYRFYSRKLDWQQASETCRSEGGSWPVWSPSTLTDQANLKKQLDLRGWTAVWTALRKTHFKKFKWVDGKVEDFQDANKHGHCVALKTSTRQISNTSLTCWAPSVGALCQKDDCSTCAARDASHCRSVDNQCFMWSAAAMTWHVAERWCRNKGWQLALHRDSGRFRNIFPSNLKFRYYWIGLRNVDWTSGTEDKMENNVEFHMWPNTEPKKEYQCVVNKRIDNIWYWVTEECSRGHHFVCTDPVLTEVRVSVSQENSFRPTTSHQPATTESVKPEQDISADIQQKAPSGGGSAISMGVIGALGAVLVTVLLIIGIYFVRKRMKSRDQGVDMGNKGVTSHCSLNESDLEACNPLSGHQADMPCRPDAPPVPLSSATPAMRYSTLPRPAPCARRLTEEQYNLIRQSLSEEHVYSELNFGLESQIYEMIVKAVKEELTKGPSLPITKEMEHSLIQDTTRTIVEEYLCPLELREKEKCQSDIRSKDEEEGAEGKKIVHIDGEKHIEQVIVSAKSNATTEENKDPSSPGDSTEEQVKRVLTELLQGRHLEAQCKPTHS